MPVRGAFDVVQGVFAIALQGTQQDTALYPEPAVVTVRAAGFIMVVDHTSVQYPLLGLGRSKQEGTYKE